jgi:predicted nuclease of predicted toxin-antitoxin system
VREGKHVRFLADECCDFALVQTLRNEGHDVLAVCEINPGATDDYVLELALGEKRILLTEDKDFGQLVYAYGRRTLGVIFLRYPASVKSQIFKSVINLVGSQGKKLEECFITVQSGRIRIGRTPVS